MDMTTGDMIVVKQVKVPKTESERNNSEQIAAVDALKSESDILRNLDHPHIVQYLGFEQTEEALSM
jgi:serine/threonine protein kinase